MLAVVAEGHVVAAVAVEIAGQNPVDCRLADAAPAADAAVDALEEFQLPGLASREPHYAVLIDQQQAEDGIPSQAGSGGRLDARRDSHHSSLVGREPMEESSTLLEPPGLGGLASDRGERQVAGDLLAFCQHHLINRVEVVAEPLEHTVGEPGLAKLAVDFE